MLQSATFDKHGRRIDNTGFDGKALFATDHPLLSGGTCSNLVEGELSVENLKKAIVMMRNFKDEAGKKVVYKADTLVVPPALEFKAIELLNSINQADSELNNVNSLKGKLKIVVLDFLESDTAWFVMDSSRHELNFFWRVRPEFKREEDFDTLVAKYRGYMRYSYGYSDSFLYYCNGSTPFRCKLGRNMEEPSHKRCLHSVLHRIPRIRRRTWSDQRFRCRHSGSFLQEHSRSYQSFS